MDKLKIQGGVLILMLVALPLTSLGTTTDREWASYLGLAAIAIGGLTMPVLRFAGSDDDGNGGDDGQGDER